MRQMEFDKLVAGDIIYNPDEENEPWTVAAYSMRHKTFLLLCGRHELSLAEKGRWLVMAMLPDELCLALADSMNFKVARIFNPAKWERQNAE